MYLLVFIQNLLVNLAEKILLPKPLTFRGDYRTHVRSLSPVAGRERFQIDRVVIFSERMTSRSERVEHDMQKVSRNDRLNNAPEMYQVDIGM